MKYTVYVLSSIKFQKSYVGFTNNLDRRLREHNSGKNKFSSKFNPWKLVYKKEFATKKDAIIREKYLKSVAGRRLVLRKLFT